MKQRTIVMTLCLTALLAQASVQIYVQGTNGLANINYVCSAGEVVRTFALDVSVDQGAIVAVTNYFRGLSTVAARGYGVFPASFRDNLTVASGTNVNWSAAAYSPVADVADNPVGTLPGLNSSGVTLELGALWDPTVPAAIPPPSGTLCALQLSCTAHVSVSANLARGGIIGSPPELQIVPQFAGALVGPAILSATLTRGNYAIVFQGGELETAGSVDGPWIGTGNTSGNYVEAVGSSPAKFYRVHFH